MNTYDILQHSADLIAAQFGEKFHGIATVENTVNIVSYDLNARMSSTKAKAGVAVLRAIALGVTDPETLQRIKHRNHVASKVKVAPTSTIYRIEIPAAIATNEAFLTLIQRHTESIHEALRYQPGAKRPTPIPVDTSIIH